MNTAPPPVSNMEKDMRAAIKKIGVAMPRDQQIQTKPNGDTYLKPQGIFAETRKWHLAAVKVFEYCEAQLNMDLFKDDPEATQIFNSIIMKGFQAIQSEASAGGRF